MSLIKDILMTAFSGVGLQFLKKSSASNDIKIQNAQIENLIIPQQKIQNENKSNENEIVQRIIKVFEAHEVHKNEIPRVVPSEYGISLISLKDDKSFLEKITPEFVDWLCTFFGIRREHIEKGDQRLYDTADYYKNERELLLYIKGLQKEGKEFYIYAFKNVEKLSKENEIDRHHRVNILIREKIFDKHSLTIYKNIPTSTLWYWGYWRSRHQFKAIARILHLKLNVFMKGYDLHTDQIERLSAGELFYSDLNLKTHFSWHPEDYSLSSKESAVAKETDETESVVSYIQEASLTYKI